MRLMREIRLSLGPEPAGDIVNSWAGWPAAAAIQPYVVLRAIVSGEPDPRIGYLCNIKHLDRLLRDQAIPILNQVVRSAPLVTPQSVIRAIAKMLAPQAPAGTRWAEWEMRITPFLSYGVRAENLDMVYVTQSFEFAAAHRLHCPELSDAENRDVFGKCNNPNGHGHNYQVEVTVEVAVGSKTPPTFSLGHLERTVKQQVIDRFDHKHLNADCVEFRQLNPSVENITRVAWDLLQGRFGTARLAKVRVWETPKTYAEYEGGEGRTV